ncbi:MAG: glucokinase [Azonexus sp.]|nr:glucokinase [Betaproteobacteria bacterium]MBK8916808.1 glucokinase [Betaproteobacteria bacterium]MBP6036613.1 glucokinase [Azonexus sp.]MBP6907222.1 glucokinase [Azonexus sp.]
MPITLLGGDLGGTKTLLALTEIRRGYPGIVREERFASQDYDQFEEILAAFLHGYDTPIVAACFGIAGPVEGRSARLTYLPWRLDADALEKRFSIGQLRLVNDFAAAAQGIDFLSGNAVLSLQDGIARGRAPRLILGAGTGLGVAGQVWSEGRYRVVPGEGGHAGFSPQTAEQRALATYLAERTGRVTAEDVLSGPGLARIHSFLTGSELPPDEIGIAALAGEEEAERTVAFWLAALGAFAGDLALQWLARGGVYLAGGVAAKLLPALSPEPFIRAFRDKREHAGLVEQMPIHLIRDERLGLLGALALAAQQSGTGS